VTVERGSAIELIGDFVGEQDRFVCSMSNTRAEIGDCKECKEFEWRAGEEGERV
jgi:hypothetical protein